MKVKSGVKITSMSLIDLNTSNIWHCVRIKTLWFDFDGMFDEGDAIYFLKM
jgi:hypothetical protein